MRLSRRGLILGGSALLAGCSSAASTTNLQLAGAAPASLPVVPVPTVTPQPVAVAKASGPIIDPHGVVRKDLMERARTALDTHGIAYETHGETEVVVSLPAEDMGRLALREQLVLTSLGRTDGDGLEDVFFTLTGQSQATEDPDPAPAPGATS